MKKVSLMALFLGLAACSGHKKSAQVSADQINCLNSLKQPGVVKTAEDNIAINKFCVQPQLSSPQAVKCARNTLAANGGDVKSLEEAKKFCAVKTAASRDEETGGAGSYTKVYSNGSSPEGLVNHNEIDEAEPTGAAANVPGDIGDLHLNP